MLYTQLAHAVSKREEAYLSLSLYLAQKRVPKETNKQYTLIPISLPFLYSSSSSFSLPPSLLVLIYLFQFTTVLLRTVYGRHKIVKAQVEEGGEEMTWCNESSDEEELNNSNNNNDSKAIHQIMTNNEASGNNDQVVATKPSEIRTITCPSCGHNIQLRQDQGGIHELPGLPAGVKFDPNDVEILEHLEAKVLYDVRKLHPLIDDFIPTLQGENGICYTHPEKLPGVNKDGQVRHFFHRPSKAYTTGTRKRRKVHTDEEGSETRWHKTGKTRAVLCNGTVKGFKKILVLYTNYGRQKKPEKTNWVMHQYHLGTNEEEKDGELVVSKVFFQTQPRQCGLKDPYDQKGMILTNDDNNNNDIIHDNTTTTIIDKEAAAAAFVDYYSNPPYISYDHLGHHNNSDHHQSSPQLIPNLVVQGDHASSFIRLTVDHSNKARLDRKI